MSGQLTPIRIFVSGPSDVQQEREQLRKLIAELNMPDGLAEQRGCLLRILDWRDAVGGMGPTEQIILKQFPLEQWDIFIGMLWTRFGTPSGSKDPHTGLYYDSGTQEEFLLAYNAWKQNERPHILVYKCQRPTEPDNINPEEWSKVRTFWENFAQTGEHPGRFGTYSLVGELEDIVRNDIIRLLPKLKLLPSPPLPSFAAVVPHLESEDSEFAATDIEWMRYDREGVRGFFTAAEKDADDMSQLFDILREWRLICSTGDKWVFTKVGALLLGPADRIVKYGYTDVRVEDVKGNIKPLRGHSLSHLIFELIDVLDKEIKGSWEDPSRRDAEGRPLQIPPYPRTAIIEAVVNFVIHRDYTSNDVAWIKIHDDRIQMTNPGTSTYSEEELLSEKELYPQYKTNPYIIHIFTRAGLNQRQGGGIKRIIQVLRENGNLFPDGRPALEIKNDKDSNRFSLVLYATKKTPLTSNSSSAQIFLHQLRPPSGDFVGRTAEIERLVQSISSTARDNSATAVITGIRGMGGIGKTELAYAVAQQLVHVFPDAQILLELRGTSNTPLSPIQALQNVIRAFDPDARLPDDLSTLQGIYRSLLNDKRVLILADDARDATQIRPLFPLRGSALIVTSRQRFTLPGMVVLDLSTLPPDDAKHLLLTICPRIGDAASQLAALCGYLPLALRVSASLLASDTSLSVERYVMILTDERARLVSLRDPDDPTFDVEASLNLSYTSLDANAQSMLCQLSVFAGSFDLSAAQAVVQIDGDCQVMLGLLVRRSLLEWDVATGRYQLHDLVRAFAANHLGEAEEVRRRHARYYAQVAQRVDALYKEGGAQLLAGLALFDRERVQIDSGWEWLRQQPPAPVTDDLLLSYTNATAYIGDLRYDKRNERIPQLEAALQAAGRTEQRSYELAALINLGDAYRLLGDYHQASAFFDQSLRLARETEDQINEANVLNNLGLLYTDRGNLHRGIAYHVQALAIIREINDPRSEGTILGNLGSAYANLGELRRAIDYHEQALAISRALGDRRGEGNAEINLGTAYTNMGESQRATEYFKQALSISREIGDRRSESIALSNLGLAYAAIGDMHHAITYFEQALVISREIGDRRGEAIVSRDLGLAYEQQGKLTDALERMQFYVDFAREIGFADVEKRTEHLERVRKRLLEAKA